MLMTLAHSSLPSEGHRLVLQLRSELHAGRPSCMIKKWVLASPAIEFFAALPGSTDEI